MVAHQQSLTRTPPKSIMRSMKQFPSNKISVHHREETNEVVRQLEVAAAYADANDPAPRFHPCHCPQALGMRLLVSCPTSLGTIKTSKEVLL